MQGHGYYRVAGVDEVGRGSLAGPVVAAAVILPRNDASLSCLAAVRESKQLAADRRAELRETIFEVAVAVGLGWSTHQAVDRLGIAVANRRAMLRAVARLSLQPDALVLDYFCLPECSLPQVCLPRGDALSLSVACASIVAKVFRDRWMTRCDQRFPGYGFAQHKGYGTAMHREAIQARGPCPVHRRSFRPVTEG